MAQKEGDTCPYCGKAELVVISADEPWNDEHLQCPECDSTYNIEQPEAGEGK